VPILLPLIHTVFAVCEKNACFEVALARERKNRDESAVSSQRPMIQGLPSDKQCSLQG
jgi:hypothetical protein